jgi:hypothetical protein
MLTWTEWTPRAKTNQIGELMRRSTFDDTAPGRVRFRALS